MPKKVQKKKLAIHHSRFILGTAAVAVVLVLVYVLLGLKDLVGQATVTEGAACEHGKFYLSDAGGTNLELCNCVGNSCAKGSCQGAVCGITRELIFDPQGGTIRVTDIPTGATQDVTTATTLNPPPKLGARLRLEAIPGAQQVFHRWSNPDINAQGEFVVTKDARYAAEWTTCGDGVQQPSEECDDGNAANEDGCSSSCTTETASGTIGVVETCLSEPSLCASSDWSVEYLRYRSYTTISDRLSFCYQYAAGSGDYNKMMSQFIAEYGGKSYVVSVSIPGVMAVETPTRTFGTSVAEFNKYFYCPEQIADITIEPESLMRLSLQYPSGNAHVETSLLIIDPQTHERTEIIKHRTPFAFTPLAFNRDYKIGIIQVLPEGKKLEDLYYCFGRRTYVGASGQWFLDVVEASDLMQAAGVCNNRFCPTCLANEKETRVYSNVKDLLFSDSPYTDLPSSQRFYSLNSVDDYWEDLLARHELNNKPTVLGVNPTFSLTFLDPVQKNLPESWPIYDLPSASETSAFFETVRSENNIDLDQFDFYVYVYYGFPNANGGRYFHGKKERIFYELGPSWESRNGFLTLLHELGHNIFGLSDLYSGSCPKIGSLGKYGPEYPIGIPDPGIPPVNQNNVCIMAKNRVIGPDVINCGGEGDMSKQILCVDDIVRILKKSQNPQCSQRDFEDNKCEDCSSGTCIACTSDNYLKCTVRAVATSNGVSS